MKKGALKDSNQLRQSKRNHISSISNHNNSNNYIINSNNKYSVSEMME